MRSLSDQISMLPMSHSSVNIALRISLFSIFPLLSLISSLDLEYILVNKERKLLY